MTVDAAPNAEQVREWNGAHGTHWVEHRETYDRILAPFVDRLVDAAAPGSDDRVLDIGCGNGASTRAMARSAERVLGIDLSGPMIENARRLASDEGLANVRFVRGDVQTHGFEPSGFDGAVSRFGVMFFDDPVVAFTNIGRALRPGGRLVFCSWRPVAENEWLMVPAGAALEHVPFPELGEDGRPGPFSLAEPDRIRALLTAAGFEQITVEALDEPLRFGSDATATAEFMAGTELARTLFAEVSPETAERAVQAMREALVDFETGDGVLLRSASWLVIARVPAVGGAPTGTAHGS